MRLAMAENDEMSLELFEMIEVTAFIEDGQHMPVEGGKHVKTIWTDSTHPK